MRTPPPWRTFLFAGWALIRTALRVCIATFYSYFLIVPSMRDADFKCIVAHFIFPFGLGWAAGYDRLSKSKSCPYKRIASQIERLADIIPIPA